MTKQELADACIRVVSNRCRNLRKTIDKAKSWEQAIENGTVLNEEQLASIRSVPKKEALLAELQEILRKQTTIIDSHLKEVEEGREDNKKNKKLINDDQKSCKTIQDEQDNNNNDIQSIVGSQNNSSKSSPSNEKLTNHKFVNGDTMSAVTQIDREDDNKSELANLTDHTDTPPSSAIQSTQTTNTPINHLSGTNTNKSNDINVNGTENGLSSLSHMNQQEENINNSIVVTNETFNNHNHELSTNQLDSLSTSIYTNNNNNHHHHHQTPILTTSTHSAHISKIVDELEEKHSKDLEEIKMACVQAILNLFHVCDFLKQEGTRQSIMAYLSSIDARHISRPLTDLDFDLLCYFHVMLTSPNGYVPHTEAVDVSTAHCLEYLKASRSEAFKGTTYADLAEIVHAVATCPLVADRGKPSLTTQYIQDPLINNIQG